MASNTYQNTTQRVGIVKGAMLKHAQAVEALGISAGHEMMPRKGGDTIKYRRFLPYGASAGTAASINTISVDPNAHLTNDGVTPEADSVVPNDVTVRINQYACLYQYTDKNEDLHEDDIPRAQIIQAGERMGLVREMIAYGALKACTNKFYAGGTTRLTVDETVSLNLLRKITASIMGNRGRPVTRVLAPGVNFNTSGVEQSFLVFVHTDAENDVRNLPGFRETVAYGSRQTVHEMEIGAVDRYRFIVSPELSSIVNSGASVGTTGLKSTGGSTIDVYPMVVVGQDAWADLALRGSNSLEPTHIPVNTKSKSDPLGQRGYVGVKFYSAAFIKNDGWMAVAEIGVTSL